MKEHFNPWTATEEELAAVYAEAAAEFHERGYVPRNHNFAKFMAWCSVKDLEEQAPFSGWQILNAIRACLAAEITAPEWLQNEYCSRLNRVMLDGALWNDPEVFGPEREKYQNRKNETEQTTIGYKLFTAIKNGELPKIKGHSSKYSDQLQILADQLELGISGYYAEKLLARFRKIIKKLPKINPD